MENKKEFNIKFNSKFEKIDPELDMIKYNRIKDYSNKIYPIKNFPINHQLKNIKSKINSNKNLSSISSLNNSQIYLNFLKSAINKSDENIDIKHKNVHKNKCIKKLIGQFQEIINELKIETNLKQKFIDLLQNFKFDIIKSKLLVLKEKFLIKLDYLKPKKSKIDTNSDNEIDYQILKNTFLLNTSKTYNEIKLLNQENISNFNEKFEIPNLVKAIENKDQNNTTTLTYFNKTNAESTNNNTNYIKEFKKFDMTNNFKGNKKSLKNNNHLLKIKNKLNQNFNDENIDLYLNDPSLIIDNKNLLIINNLIEITSKLEFEKNRKIESYDEEMKSIINNLEQGLNSLDNNYKDQIKLTIQKHSINNKGKELYNKINNNLIKININRNNIVKRETIKLKTNSNYFESKEIYKRKLINETNIFKNDKTKALNQILDSLKNNTINVEMNYFDYLFAKENSILKKVALKELNQNYFIIKNKLSNYQKQNLYNSNIPLKKYQNDLLEIGKCSLNKNEILKLENQFFLISNQYNNNMALFNNNKSRWQVLTDRIRPFIPQKLTQKFLNNN